MKKIINGKKYDTETATMLGEMDNGYPGNDFHYTSEELYRKRTGEFFLHGVGGALSKYAVSEGTGWGGGEKIIPISIDDAKVWAEKWMTADRYEEIFGEVEE